MFETSESPTAHLSLATVLARLAARPEVEGIVIMGSAGAGTLTPASDYDLFVILAALPMPLRLVLTIVDQRLTEVYVAPTATLDRLVTGEPLPDGADDLRPAMTAWIRTGRVAFDRHGQLARVRAALADREPFVTPTDAQIYARWAHTSYNVRQTTRMATSDERAYQAAVELRVLYGVGDLIGDYFAVRRLPYRGEKAAARYWLRHDPAYLRLLRETLAERELERRVALYQARAALTLSPVGGLVDATATTVTLAGDQFSLGAVEEALALWQRLVASES